MGVYVHVCECVSMRVCVVRVYVGVCEHCVCEHVCVVSICEHEYVWACTCVYVSMCV